MQKSKLLRTAAISLLALSPSLVLAEAGVSTCEDTSCPLSNVTSNVNLEINIPEILIFRIGQTGDTVNTVSWNVSPAGLGNNLQNASYNGGDYSVNAPAGEDDDNVASNGSLNVYAYANTGAIDIIASGSFNENMQHDTDSTLIIPLSEITVTGDSHPSGLHAGTAGQVAHVSNVAELIGDWQYAYNPTRKQAAGTYTAEITYTASTP